MCFLISFHLRRSAAEVGLNLNTLTALSWNTARQCSFGIARL